MAKYKWWEIATGLALPKAIGEKTNKSWIGIIINPVGYALGRSSNANASQDYYSANAINLNGINSVEQYERLKAQWVDGCAAKLKGDDPGKSLANASLSCESRWNNDPAVLTYQEAFGKMQAEEDQQAREQTQQLIKVVIFMILIAVAIYFFIKVI